MAAKEPTLEEWITEIGGLSEAGRNKLEKATIISLAAVKAISEQDIEDVKFGLGDRAVFRAGWRKLTGVAAPVAVRKQSVSERLSSMTPPPARRPSPPRRPSQPIASADGAAESVSSGEPKYFLADFAELLKVLPSKSAPVLPSVIAPVRRFGVASDDVTPQTLSKNQALRDLASSLGHQIVKDTLDLDYYADKGQKGERYLLFVNFTTVLGGNFGEEDDVISTA
jgi:hypothetical protein